MAAIQSLSVGVWFTQLQNRREALAILKVKGDASLFRLQATRDGFVWGNRAILVTSINWAQSLTGGKSDSWNGHVSLESPKLLFLTLQLKYLWTECSGEIRCLFFTVYQQKDTFFSHSHFTFGGLEKKSFQDHIFKEMSKTIMKPWNNGADWALSGTDQDV